MSRLDDLMRTAGIDVPEVHMEAEPPRYSAGTAVDVVEDGLDYFIVPVSGV